MFPQTKYGILQIELWSIWVKILPFKVLFLNGYTYLSLHCKRNVYIASLPSLRNISFFSLSLFKLNFPRSFFQFSNIARDNNSLYSSFAEIIERTFFFFFFGRIIISVKPANFLSRRSLFTVNDLGCCQSVSTTR